MAGALEALRRLSARALVTAARLPALDQLATIKVFGLALVVEVAVRAAPLPTVARWFGVSLNQRQPRAPEPRPVPLRAWERRQLRAGLRLMRHWPFDGGPCLRQALLLGWILRQRHPLLVIGVGRPAGDLAAHAWLEVQGRTVGSDGAYLPLDRGQAPPARR